MRSFIKVSHERFTLILRKGMLPFHWIAESRVYPDKGYVTAVRERANYGAVWALSSMGVEQYGRSRSGHALDLGGHQMVGRKDGLMRFHKISPCPKCGGKVKAKWEEQHYLSALVFRCGGCRYKPYALALKSKPAVEWEWPKDMMLAAAIRRWNAMCNGDKRYRLIYESLGGRR